MLSHTARGLTAPIGVSKWGNLHSWRGVSGGGQLDFVRFSHREVLRNL